MTTKIPDGDRRAVLFGTVNDRFKAGWTVRVYWSTVLAVGLHAALFLWYPAWDRSASTPDEDVFGLQVVSVQTEPGPMAGEGIPLALVSGSEDEGEDPPEPPPEPSREDGEAGGQGGGPGGLEGTLRAQLQGRGAPVPTVVESDPEPVDEESETEAASRDDESDGETSRIDGRALLSEYEEALSAGDGPDLSRLSAFRPELALHNPSNWVLLSNPAEVSEFLESRFRGPELEAESPGMLTVAMWIDERGSVEWAEIYRSSGHEHLDESALELFQEVVSFLPARERGVHVPMAVVFGLSYPW
jgi:TonB family protein